MENFDKKIKIETPKTKETAIIEPMGFGGFNNKEIAILKATSFSTCKTNEEVAVACSLAKKYDLDPFAQEIWAMNMKGKMIIQASASGWRKLVKKTSNFEEGSLIVNAVFEEDDFNIDNISGEVTHKSGVPKKDATPVGAYCRAIINGKPIAKFVRWEEYAKNDSYSPWQKQKSEMICAKASAVFGRTYCNISGLYSEGEVSEENISEKKEEPKMTNQEKFSAKKTQLLEMKKKKNDDIVDAVVVKTKK